MFAECPVTIVAFHHLCVLEVVEGGEEIVLAEAVHGHHGRAVLQRQAREACTRGEGGGGGGGGW
jgi:hypothetical protein